MDKTDIELINLLIESTINRKLKEAEAQMETEPGEDGNKSKPRVDRFFNQLGRSALAKYVNFKTPQEKAHAIIRFADMVGVPKSQLTKLFSGLRDATK